MNYKKIKKKKTKKHTNIKKFSFFTHLRISLYTPSKKTYFQCSLFISLPPLSRFVIQRIVRIWRGQQRLNRQQNLRNLQSRTPVLLQNIQTNSPKIINIRMINLSYKQRFGSFHRVVLRQIQLHVKDATCELIIKGTGNLRRGYLLVPRF